VYDLLLEVWHVLAAEILSYAKSSRSSGSDDHPWMSSKAEKLCSSEKCGESFFCSSVRYVIGCLWARIYYALKRSGVAPPCWGASPMQNPPILRDGLENADLFPMSGPASWCFLIPKRFCKEVSTHSKKKKTSQRHFNQTWRGNRRNTYSVLYLQVDFYNQLGSYYASALIIIILRRLPRQVWLKWRWLV